MDVNLGDPIHPEPREIAVPRLLGGEIILRGYPLPMVLAEKIVTAVQRGPANTRWRDYADLYLLSCRHDVGAAPLREAVTAVAEYRQAVLLPLAEVLDGFVSRAQSRWAAWRRRQRMESHLPAEFDAVVDRVIAFADPILTPGPAKTTWRADVGRWSAGS